MAAERVFTGDTVDTEGTFRNSAEALVDPEDSEADAIVYDADQRSIITGAATRLSTGVYMFSWIVPDTEGTYFVEIKGMFSGKPQLGRKTYSAKFKPAA